MTTARFTLFGKVVLIDKEKVWLHLRLKGAKIAPSQECFLRQHPDAKWWIPDRMHDFHFYEFLVEGIYWIGGFGK